MAHHIAKGKYAVSIIPTLFTIHSAAGARAGIVCLRSHAVGGRVGGTRVGVGFGQERASAGEFVTGSVTGICPVK